MTEIAELERRITAALDRIGSGLDGLLGAAEAMVDPSELDGLRAALDDEKTANAQLEERVKSLHEQNDIRQKELEGELASLKSTAYEAKLQLQTLRKTNQHLQTSLQTLREAAANGVAEPHLINQAMMSELDGLRSVRDADRAEMDDILGALEPMLKEANNA